MSRLPKRSSMGPPQSQPPSAQAPQSRSQSRISRPQSVCPSDVQGPCAQSTPASRTVPRSGGVPRASSGYGRVSGVPSVSSIRSTASTCEEPTCGDKKTRKDEGKRPKKPKSEKQVAKDIVGKQEETKKQQYELPPLSVLLPKKQTFEEFEKLKAKTRRRNAPEGEDTKAIREILKEMVNKEVTVHEFVGMLSPYTADNGTCLRTVLANELSHFRTMARRVYDTMTQDVSDVLINEHIQLTEASKERHTIYTDKMMRAIDEIYEYAPNFNFEKYYADPKYLELVFPMAEEILVDEETEALQMRQEAYHRLMWLRSEGDRLAEENKRLGDRLKELKQRQKEQMRKAGEFEKVNEDKRKELEKTQEALEEQLEVMNTSIERSIVEQEKAIRERADSRPREKKPKKTFTRETVKKPPENWGTKAAAQIEESQATEMLVSEVSKVSMASSAGTSKGAVPKPSTGAVPKQPRAAKGKGKGKKSKFVRPPKVPQDGDAFHYSPIKTPPEAAARPRERSPFHFSPLKTPPGPRAQTRERSPFHYSPIKTPPAGASYQEEARGGFAPPTQTMRVTTTTTSSDQAPPKPAPPRLGRRGAGPRDSWGGFF